MDAMLVMLRMGIYEGGLIFNDRPYAVSYENKSVSSKVIVYGWRGGGHTQTPRIAFPLVSVTVQLAESDSVSILRGKIKTTRSYRQISPINHLKPKLV
jgi:hypothetical protein